MQSHYKYSKFDKPGIIRMQQDQTEQGVLQVNVFTAQGYVPVPGALIRISYTAIPDTQIDQQTTDESGQTTPVELPTPPRELSMEPGSIQPYAEYTVQVEAPGYRNVNITGVELFSGELAILPVLVNVEGPQNESIVIPANTLFGNFPPKIEEAEIKPLEETGEIVLSRVVIPEYIIVHDGPPSDSRASNYYVRYRDYIKNVASCEIYSTWPDATLRANILAIMSFTLNRVFTEWYRNKGFDFTITSSTAYDHKWVFGRNIFSNISRIVDEMFNNYLSRPNVTQPILTQYCDGHNVSCPGWMTQWGSKNLGDQGYSTIAILRYFYGSNMYINTAEEIAGVPASWPGYNLGIGATGPKVRQLQLQLNAISNNFPAIPKITVDGIYGQGTANAVKAFQRVFDLPQTGITDFSTWYKISQIYVGVTRIAELY